MESPSTTRRRGSEVTSSSTPDGLPIVPGGRDPHLRAADLAFEREVGGPRASPPPAGKRRGARPPVATGPRGTLLRLCARAARGVDDLAGHEARALADEERDQVRDV